MKLRTGCLLLVLIGLTACASAPRPGVPVPAGDGYVWVLKDDGRGALWGPPASEAVFAVACVPAAGRIEFRHYGLAAPTAGTALRIEAGDASASYPTRLHGTELGDHLVATTPASDPFLQQMLQAGQWRVQADGQTLLIGVSEATLRPVLDGCGA